MTNSTEQDAPSSEQMFISEPIEPQKAKAIGKSAPLGLITSHILFWSWNLLFISFVGLGLAPFVLWSLFVSLFYGEVPINFGVYATILLSIPFISILLAARYFRSEKDQIIGLFYGVEAPLFLLCLFRLFIINDLTPGLQFIYLMSFVGIISYFLQLQKQRLSESSIWAHLQLLGHVILFLFGIYLATIILFYAIPFASTLIMYLFSFRWLSQMLRGLQRNTFGLFVFSIIGIPLFLYSASLFIAMPLVLLRLYQKSCRRVHTEFSKIYGMIYTNILIVGSVLILVTTTLYLNKQGQSQAFATVEAPVTEISIEQKLDQKKMIQSGLLNAYLGKWRYFGSSKSTKHIRNLYRGAFGFPESINKSIQNAYTLVVWPFVYNSVNIEKNRYTRSGTTDHHQAGKLYEQFFDKSIQKAEQKAVLKAVTSTIVQRSREASLLDVGQKKVLLEQQNIRIKENGDWAEIELHEVYVNQTFQRQEIMYYFSLPESAAITGMWLGTSSERDKRHKYIVAPRGAAQRVYKRQVRRRIDPSLLSQVGPRQYRLRAFPIQPKIKHLQRRWRTNSQTKVQEKMHLWLTYKVMRQPKGWPMPQRLEHRNVYWSSKTQRTLQGNPFYHGKGWTTDFIKASAQNSSKSYQAKLPGEYTVFATPLTSSLNTYPRGKKIAIVLDRSYSMTPYKKQVNQLFKKLQSLIMPSNQVDLYLTSSPYRKQEPSRQENIQEFAPEKVIYYGGQSMQTLLNQFEALRAGKNYDLVMIITDENSITLAKSKGKLHHFPAPVWMVHVSPQMAPAYDDATLDTLQKSGGGVTQKPFELLKRLSESEQVKQQKNRYKGTFIRIADGYIWSYDKEETTSMEKKVQGFQFNPTAGFAQLAGKQLINAKIRAHNVEKLTFLDQIHTIAKTLSIVSSYSSMIVLINQTQKNELKKESKRKNRFKRDKEDGKQQLQPPVSNSPFPVSGTPEPEEWLLIFLGLAMLLYQIKKQKQSQNCGNLA